MTRSRAVLALAIALALTFGVLCPAVLLPDSETYLAPARSWARGDGFLDAAGQPMHYRLPAYPLVLGVVLRLFGESLRAMTLVNVALHVGAMLLARSLVARRHEAIADGAAALGILYPPFLTAAATVLQESLLSFLVALFAWSLTRALESPRPAAALGAGASLGLAALGKVVVLPLALPAAIAAALLPRRMLLRGAALVIGAGAVLAPWAVRNQVVLGRFEVTNNNGGHTLLGGTVTNAIDDWYGFPEYRAAVSEWERAGHRAEPALDRYLYSVAVQRIRADPARWLRLIAERVVRFMLPARQWMSAVGLASSGSLTPWLVAGAALQAALFLATALLAIAVLRRRGPWPMLVGPAVVYWHLVIYALVYVSPRYNVTVGPLLVSSAALFVALRRGNASTSPIVR